MPNRRFTLLEPIVAATVCLVLVSNIIAQKFFSVPLLGLPVTTDVGTLLLFPFTYILSDILTEVYGYGASRRVVWYSFGANILAALLFGAAVALPHSPEFANQGAFAAVLGVVPGLVVASLAGAWFGSFTNDSVLSSLKVWMVRWDPEHHWLPLRTIGSTVLGELVDTFLFVGVAVLFGIFPASEFTNLVVSQWLIKTLVETLFTPLTVVVIRAVKKYEGLDMVGTETLNPFAFSREGGENRYH